MTVFKRQVLVICFIYKILGRGEKFKALIRGFDEMVIGMNIGGALLFEIYTYLKQNLTFIKEYVLSIKEG